MAKKTDSAKSGGAAAPAVAMPEGYRPRMYDLYLNEIRSALKEELGLPNIMQVPRLEKIVLNMGVGEGSRDEKVLVAAEEDLALIAGQKPRRNRARISVANFKLRQGMPVGCSVTLRGWRMWEFLERLINVAIPRIRDFRGLPPKAFDGRGNYNFGVREHQIFTEIDITTRQHSFGMDVTFVTTAGDNERSRALLRRLGLPLRQV